MSNLIVCSLRKQCGEDGTVVVAPSRFRGFQQENASHVPREKAFSEEGHSNEKSEAKSDAEFANE